jgi:hypothetical protein
MPFAEQDDVRIRGLLQEGRRGHRGSGGVEQGAGLKPCGLGMHPRAAVGAARDEEQKADSKEKALACQGFVHDLSPDRETSRFIALRKRRAYPGLG